MTQKDLKFMDLVDETLMRFQNEIYHLYHEKENKENVIKDKE